MKKEFVFPRSYLIDLPKLERAGAARQLQAFVPANGGQLPAVTRPCQSCNGAVQLAHRDSAVWKIIACQGDKYDRAVGMADRQVLRVRAVGDGGNGQRFAVEWQATQVWIAVALKRSVRSDDSEFGAARRPGHRYWRLYGQQLGRVESMGVGAVDDVLCRWLLLI